MDNKKIGQYIAMCRKEKGLTQRDIAEKLYITSKAVSKWERGLSLPDISLLEPLAKELGVSIAEILKGETICKLEKNVVDNLITASGQEYVSKTKEKYARTSALLASFVIILCICASLLTLHYWNIQKDLSTIGNHYHPSCDNVIFLYESCTEIDRTPILLFDEETYRSTICYSANAHSLLTNMPSQIYKYNELSITYEALTSAVSDLQTILLQASYKNGSYVLLDSTEYTSSIETLYSTYQAYKSAYQAVRTSASWKGDKAF